MKIITVNLPDSYIKAIDNLIGDEMSFPSRSELVRVAVREFLIKELESAQSITKTVQTINSQQREPTAVLNKSNNDNSELFVQVPLTNELDGPIAYKTFRIIHK